MRHLALPRFSSPWPALEPSQPPRRGAKHQRQRIKVLISRGAEGHLPLTKLIGKRPQGIQPHRSTRRKPPRLQEQPAPERTEYSRPLAQSQDPPAPIQSKGRKRSIEDALDPSPDQTRKRPRASPTRPAGSTLSEPAASTGAAQDETDPIAHWAKEGRWPRRFCEPEESPEPDLAMEENYLARKRPSSVLSRKRSNSATSTMPSEKSASRSKTPSDQKPREEKSAPYRDQRYETLLETKGSLMAKSVLDIARASKTLCGTLLKKKQTVPEDTLFRNDIFESTCQKIQNRNEARVIQDITRLIVPSAESLATFGAKHLDILAETINEGWNNSIPLTGTRPQPDYSVGFKREAFTEDQLTKLSPLIGNWLSGDLSFYMATYYMYFPFLACEVKCGAAALDVADRQNAHSMTLAAQAIVKLFRLVKHEDEVNRQILAFSISHDHRSVRIYGYYPVIDGKDTKYYRHPIHTFDFTAPKGKEKWTAYQFTKNVYDVWMPEHFKKICTAIDQLPSELDFGVPSLSEGLESHHLSQSDADSASVPVEQDSQSSNTDRQGVTPDTSFTVPGMKRRKGQAKT